MKEKRCSKCNTEHRPGDTNACRDAYEGGLPQHEGPHADDVPNLRTTCTLGHVRQVHTLDENGAESYCDQPMPDGTRCDEPYELVEVWDGSKWVPEPVEEG